MQLQLHQQYEALLEHPSLKEGSEDPAENPKGFTSIDWLFRYVAQLNWALRKEEIPCMCFNGDHHESSEQVIKTVTSSISHIDLWN